MKQILYWLLPLLLLSSCSYDAWIIEGTEINDGKKDDTADGKDNATTNYIAEQVRAKLIGGWSARRKSERSDGTFRWQFAITGATYQTSEIYSLSSSAKSYFWRIGDVQKLEIYTNNRGVQIAHFIYKNQISQYDYTSNNWIVSCQNNVAEFYIVVPDLMNKDILQFENQEYYFKRDNSVQIETDPYSNLVTD